VGFHGRINKIIREIFRKDKAIATAKCLLEKKTSVFKPCKSKKPGLIINKAPF